MTTGLHSTGVDFAVSELRRLNAAEQAEQDAQVRRAAAIWCRDVTASYNRFLRALDTPANPPMARKALPLRRP